jgi:hypothetical protein
VPKKEAPVKIEMKAEGMLMAMLSPKREIP